jgi:hypothetical protein
MARDLGDGIKFEFRSFRSMLPRHTPTLQTAKEVVTTFTPIYIKHFGLALVDQLKSA